MDRRTFSKAVALLPIGMAIDSALVSQDGSPANISGLTNDRSAARKRKTAQEYNRHKPIAENEPFDGAIVFSRNKARQRVETFPLNEVTLGSGPMQDARDWNRAYMLRLPNGRLLHNFRVTAGIPSRAVPLGGWEAPDSELRGHFVGHYLSAAALLFASTNDREVKEKADELVEGVAECQACLGASGYVSAFPEELFERLDRREKVWAPFYTLHKIMAGLLDMYIWAGNYQALDAMIKLAGWVDAWTTKRTETHMQEILKTEYGGMNEVLYNLADATNDDRWVRVGDRFTKKTVFTPLAMRRDELKGLHVNTHIPQVIGAARRYELSSDPRFRDVAEFFWETVAASRSYVAGGTGNTESWLTNANHLALEMEASSHHQECCCAYNMMKLTQYLYRWTGEPRYMDYYERNLFNHRLGTIEPETGHTIYFLSMSKGAWKTTCTEDQTFWCCTGTAMEDFARLNDSIYFHDEANLYVNFFVSSRVDWKGRQIRVRQKTRFPESDLSTLIIESTPAAPWTMHVRVPAWTTPEYSVRINGEPLSVAGCPGSYVAIRRTWKEGDRVELTIPMRLTVESLPDDAAEKAFLFGPIVLAGQFPRGHLDSDLEHNQGPELEELLPLAVPALESRGLPIDQSLTPASGEPLCFRHQSQGVFFKPLNQSWDRFAVYFKVS